MSRTFRVLDRHLKYEDAYTKYYALEVNSDGRREVHPGVVRLPYTVTFPLSEKGRTVLIRQYRFAVEKEMWETCAGGLEQGEAAMESAARELREEMGLQAERLEHLGHVDPTPSVIVHGGEVFLAHVRDADLDGLKPPPKEDQITDLRVVTLEELDDMVRKGEVTCGFLLTALALVKIAQAGKKD